MDLMDLLKKVRGLEVKWNNGTARVLEVYWETERALIQISEGTNYTADAGGMQLGFISDGYDKIVVDVDEICRQNGASKLQSR